ncbi:hypothetical protein QG044_10290 [Kingella kingae]|nr:hypothetical protein [Kingella kingae]MDK4555308.1 hypothetical protein [Kingella kingae]MDK4576191.1 hypothetical protein [Kingella kingae]MDK4582247.1 hypothetical protein [Kingella kingae]MDK4584389.1 hypothetical protein [Kingella kingae]MDK4588356.1 hypothetical protein [Kingella kingae]
MFQHWEYVPIKQDTFKLPPIHGRTTRYPYARHFNCLGLIEYSL